MYIPREWVTLVYILLTCSTLETEAADARETVTTVYARAVIFARTYVT